MTRQKHRKSIEKKKTVYELARELEAHPERQDEIIKQVLETPEGRKIYQAQQAKHYSSPVVQAASTHKAYKHKEETFDFEGMKDELEVQNKALRSNDLTRVEDMLMAQAHTLDMLFHKEARRAIAQDYIGQYKIHLDMAFKAQRQCRATLETLAMIKNPQPFIRQQNVAQQQIVNNGQPHAHVENFSKPTNELLEDKSHDFTRMDTGTPETASGNDKELEAVGVLDRRKNSRGKG